MTNEQIPLSGIRRKRSVKLTKEEFKRLKEYAKSFDTSTDCAEAIGISREVLFKVSLVGSGSPGTIEKIRKVLS